MKKCSKCGIEKPLTAEYYNRDKFASTGFRSQCKACRKIKEVEYRKSNKEKILKKAAEYRKNNKEKINEQQAEYRQNNKEKIAKINADYYQNNKEKFAKTNAEYYSENREKILEKKAEYRKNNREKISEKGAKWYQNNKEKIREQQAEYRKNNREKVLKRKAEYRKNNKEKISQKNAEYRKNNREKIAEYRQDMKNKQPACVYQIVNSVSNRIYIGETMRGEFRWKQHLCNLKGNRHPNCKLQEDYDKFGEEAFSWSIIQEYPKNKDVLLLEEIRTIDRFLREGKELYNLMLTIDQLKLLMDIGGDGCDINHRTITKEALAKAKTNGVKLGTHNEVVRMGREAQSKVTNDRLFPLITEARKQGLVSLQKVAAFLNDKGVKTPKGKIFTKANLSPIMKRYRKEILMEEK